jgi:hypothetical protein
VVLMHAEAEFGSWGENVVRCVDLHLINRNPFAGLGGSTDGNCFGVWEW